MRNYTFTENGFTFKRINKAQAKRAYNNGLTVRFCPVNLRPGSPFRFDMDMNKVQQNCAGVDFGQLVNAFEFYNCGSNETGLTLLPGVNTRQVIKPLPVPALIPPH